MQEVLKQICLSRTLAGLVSSPSVVGCCNHLGWKARIWEDMLISLLLVHFHWGFSLASTLSVTLISCCRLEGEVFHINRLW